MSDDLAQIQHWMQAAIMHPDGATPEEIESIITRSQALSSVERLEIYSRAYFARLLECLRSQFPILAKALGDEVFDSFALGYLQRYPSQSYTLGLLGTSFVQYLNETRPAEAWSEPLIDLARLEFMFDQVFDGPGVEDEALVRADDLLAIPPNGWPEARLVLAHCLRLLQLRFPMHEYYRSLRRDEDVPFPGPRSTYLAITRRDYVVRFLPLSRSQFVLLESLQQGAAVGVALEQVADTYDDLDQLAAELHAWFQSWTDEGFFLRIELA